jgi:pimeloyl-ACP methyl ester carboxylesterase
VSRGAKVAWWAARRHPDELIRASVVAGRHPKTVVRGIGQVRRAMRLKAALREIVADPKAQTEAKSALASITGAARRVQKVGLANAFDDKQVADHLRRASTHASRAVAVAHHPKKRRRRALVVPMTAVGAGVVAGLAYIGLNRHLAFRDGAETS